MQLPPPPAKRPMSIRHTAAQWAMGHKVLSIAVGILLVVGLVGALGDSSEAETAQGPNATQSPSRTSSPEPTVAPEPEIPTTRVPPVVGLSLRKARQQATARGLNVSIVRKYSEEPAGTVLRQSVRAGVQVDEGTSLQLVVARPFPHVPGVAGQKVRGAKQELLGAGFSVIVQLEESSTTPAGTVLYSIPAAGTQVKPGATITIVVAKAPPPPPTSSCHPSYTGACLDPNASDYDCAGGSGDGPKYTGFVHVVGYDEYGLDADGDGLGCES